MENYRFKLGFIEKVGYTEMVLVCIEKLSHPTNSIDLTGEDSVIAKNYKVSTFHYHKLERI